MKNVNAYRIQSISLNEVAATYKAIQAEMDRLEEELRPLKTMLEEAATASPNSFLDLPGYQVRISPTEREVFSLKTARERMGEQILKPFIRISRFNTLRVVDKKAA